ncbi:metal-sulfur cluster assembly factor [Halalkalicoccus sp. NIPERK01]|uniref:metal-sulfur cluster assembly factor n=1 Tax=Halalkalicoccus sp. NIPERK01 TaxID=3053469 RepID=UPI00256EAF49|nr:metal-sulfur cluster assembly factor [Halalkalicoccus sp. NIPERK01]MDL5360496.1 metal-sulfur cluster assembly factor [Halalkalicoccus sp. NIPERK01]
MSSARQRADGASGPAHASEFVERRRADATPFEGYLWDVVDEIPDPHIPVSLVEMAMIYDIEADDGAVAVEMTYPCMGCPAYDMIQNDIESCLTVLDGVDTVDVEVVWDPVWSKEMLTAEVREKMRKSGISL